MPSAQLGPGVLVDLMTAVLKLELPEAGRTEDGCGGGVDV